MSQNQSPEAIKVKLNELYEDAKTKGTVTRDEVANQLMEIEIDADQMNKIYETLESMGVDVVAEFDPVPPEELIEPEQIDLSVPEGPAPGGVHRQALCGPRNAVSGPDSGG